VALQEKATILLDLCQRLKGLLLSQGSLTVYEIAERIVKLAYNLNQSAELAVALENSSKLSSGEKASLEDIVYKLGHYYKASSDLVLAVRQTKC
jgi:hypothetical protein